MSPAARVLIITGWRFTGASAPHPFGDTLKLSFQKLWNSLEVTFLYEHFLLELRHLAFEGKSHMCKLLALVSCVKHSNRQMSFGHLLHCQVYVAMLPHVHA